MLRLNSQPVNRRTVTWKQIVFAGGGLVTHFDVSSDGTLVCGTDVGGGYVYNTVTSRWDQICEQRRMKSLPYGGYIGQRGVADIRIAYSDSNRIYYFHRVLNNANGTNEARVWRSSDKGVTSFPTNYPINIDSSLDANDQSSSGVNGVRQYNPKIAIDPANPDHVIVSNPRGYPLRTVDGGETWQSITSLPVGSSNTIGALGITFDPSGGTTGGKTNNVYLMILGTGIYRSTDAGATFSQISSTIVTPGANTAVNDGDFFVSHVLSGTRYISRYDGSAWTDIRSNASGRYVLAAHADAGKLITVRSDNQTYEITTDAGAVTPTWTSRNKASQTYASTDSPWQATRNNAGLGLTPVDAKFHGDVLYLTMGQGIWVATISGTTAPSWETLVDGIEELVVNQITNIPGANKIIISGWDEGAWIRSNSTLDTAPAATAMIVNNIALNYSWQAAVDPSNPDYIAYVGSTGLCGYSDDGGATFNAFATTPNDFGGTGYVGGNGGFYASVAVNNGVIIWNKHGSSNQFPFRSDDNGTTWDQLTVSADVPSSGDTGWQTAIATTKKWIDADQVNPSVFYMSNYRTQTPAIRGVWRSTNGGVDWTRMAAQPYTNTSFLIQTLKAVPGNEGHLFVTCGHNSTSTNPPAHPSSSDAKFYKSVDGGANWTEPDSNILEVSHFGYGKARTTGGYPTIFFAGFYKRIYGVYMVFDGDFTTIVQLDNATRTTFHSFPLHINDAITSVEGDMDIVGRCYVAFEGNGCVYADAA
jgi:hypothetical protein